MQCPLPQRTPDGQFSAALDSTVYAPHAFSDSSAASAPALHGRYTGSATEGDRVSLELG